MDSNQDFGSVLNNFSNSSQPQQSNDSFGRVLSGYGRSSQQAPADPANIDEFVKSVAPAAQRVASKLGVPVEAVIGQWGLETGWGRSVIPGTNNLGNIKSTDGRGVAATDNQTGSRDKYRQYESTDHFADDFSNLVGGGRYRGVPGAKDATSYFQGLKAGGYAEDAAYVQKGTQAAQLAAEAMGRSGVVKTQQPQGPDLSKAPKWADVEAKPEFAALPPEKKSEAKAAYFDYWIAPRAGDRRDELRQKFLAVEKPQDRSLLQATGDTLQNLAAGVLKIGPTALKGAADVGNMLTGDTVDLGVSKTMQEGMDLIDKKVASNNFNRQKKGFEAVMHDDSKGIGDMFAYMLDNPAILVDNTITTIGSMFLPAGAAKGAVAGARAMGAGSAVATKAAVASSIGAAAAQNAGDTFSTLEKQSLEDRYKGAAISAGVSILAGIATGGGAEGQIAKKLAGDLQAGRVGLDAVKQFLKSVGRETVQESGEELGNIGGEMAGSLDVPSAASAGKRTAFAGALGGVMGGGTHMLTGGGAQQTETPAPVVTTPDGRIDPAMGGDQAVAPPEEAGAPAIHPTSQTADDIVRDLATQAGIPHETVLPVQPPQIPQDEATPDQDVLDFAATRYQQLRQKRDGTRQTVMGETGPADQDMPGVGLTPAEQQEMDGLQRANGDVNLLRAQYGFDQPPTPENQSVETQTQEQPQGIGPAPSQDAIVSDGQPSGSAAVQEPAGGTEAATTDQQHAVGESGQQAGTVQAEAPLTVPLSERSEDELRAQLRSASDRGIQRAIGEELARRKETPTHVPEPAQPGTQASQEESPQGAQEAAQAVAPPRTEKEARARRAKRKENQNGTEAPQAVEATQEGPQAPAAGTVDVQAQPPVPEAAPATEGGLPGEGRTDAVEAAGLPPRGREGYDTPVTLDAASLKALVEKTRGTPLVDKPEKLEAWRNGTAKTDPAKFPIELAITPDGRLDVNDGRHRIALAAERGETVEAFIDGKDAHYAQQLVSQPSQPTGAPNVPQAAQAQQSIAQSTQARGAATAGPAAAAETVPAAPGIANVETAGLKKPGPGGSLMPVKEDLKTAKGLEVTLQREFSGKYNATIGGEPAGSVVYTDTPSGGFRVTGIDVDPKFRRKGVASAIYDFLEKDVIGQPLAESGGQSEDGIAFRRARASKVEAAGVEPEPFTHSGLKVYPIRVRIGEEIAQRWAVQTPDNAERERNGERQIGGDSILETRESAMKEAERLTKQEEGRKELEVHRAKTEREAAEMKAAERQAKADMLGDFYANENRLLRDRAAATLAKQVKEADGTVMTRADWVRKQVEAGAELKTATVDKIKPMSRTQFNRASNAEQRAHEAKVKAGGKVLEYQIGNFVVTKTEYDFAEHLKAKRENVSKKPAEIDTSEQRVDDGTVELSSEQRARIEPGIVEFTVRKSATGYWLTGYPDAKTASKASNQIMANAKTLDEALDIFVDHQSEYFRASTPGTLAHKALQARIEASEKEKAAAKPKTEKEAKAKREDANASNEKTVDIGGEKPLPKTYLNVPFASKDFAKARGAKWDAENKLWFAEPIATGMAAGEFNINLKSFVVQDTTDDERYNFYGNKDVARVVALNKSQRTGIAQVVKKTVHADGVHGWKVIVATDEASKPKTEREAIERKTKQVMELVQQLKDAGAEEYLFGQQPAVVPSILKPLVSEKPRTEKQAKEQRAQQAAESLGDADQPKTAAEWSDEMARLRSVKPRPLEKLYGKNATERQVTEHKEAVRQWDSQYRKASKMQKQTLASENEAFRKRQNQGQPQSESFAATKVEQNATAVGESSVKQTTGEGPNLSDRHAKIDAALDAMPDANIQAIYKAAGLKGNGHSAEVQRASLKEQHPDDIEPLLNAFDFVSNNGGSLDFGEITAAMSKQMRRQAGKIRLQEGLQNKDGTGFGLAHIEAKHGDQIRGAGYSNIQAFVEYALHGMDEIYAPKGNAQIIAIVSGKRSKTVFLELKPAKDEAGEFYTVNSAFPVGEDYAKKKSENEGWKPLWNKYPVLEDASGASSFAGQPPNAGGAAPMVSGQSGDASLLQPTQASKPQTEREARARKEASKVESAKSREIIDDVGEKMSGARKDKVHDLAKEFTDDEIATQPLSKVWPIQDIDAIEDPYVAAFSFAAREEVPAKPRVAYKVKRWVDQVKMLRGLALRITDGRLTKDSFKSKLSEFRGLDSFRAKVDLLEQLDRGNWKRIGQVNEYPHSYRYDDAGNKIATPQVWVEIDGRKHSIEGKSTVADALEGVKALLGEAAPEKKMQFEVRGRTGAFSINKKGDKEYRKLKTFETSKEAFAFIENNHNDLVAAWDSVKERDNVKESDVRGGENKPRTGDDWRKGADVSGEEFRTRFGFRGVEFGNWVEQGANAKARQGMINQAYDALMDLASIMGVPPKALSLNGTLGIAFGSRGSGAYSAHFEPDNIVINLTKTKGAGTLAHEFFHALDNYFSRQRGGEVPIKRGMNAQQAYREQNYITYRPEPMYVRKDGRGMGMTLAQLERNRAQSPKSGYFAADAWHVDPKHPQGVRPAVEKAFTELVDALDASPMKARAAKNDKGSDGYWSRIIERAARSFENYVISRMMAKGYDNDYLANVRQVQDFARDKERYPYLLPEEIAPVAEAFNNLFDTIQTREDASGNVVMFNRKDDNSSDETGIKDNSIDTQRAIEMLERRFGRAYMVSHPVEGWSTDETKAVAPIAQAFGSKVVGYKVRPENKRFDTWDMAGSNGAQAVGHIFLNVESGRPHLSILGHETAHEMRKRRPDLYAKLVNAIESYVDKDKYSNVFRNSKVGRGSLRDGMTPDQVEDSIQEEFIGEVLSDGFMDAGFWRALGQKNKQLLAQVWAFVGKILGKVMGLGGTGYTKRTEQYLNDYAKVMQIAGEVMAEYGMNPSTMAKAMGVPVFNRWVVDLTKTPEFKRWFGDSKVVDKDGKPLLVYHGTTKSFYAFITGTGWFTSDPGEANFWGGMNADGANVVPAYLSIKNPRVLQASEASKNKILDALESLQNDEDGVIVIEDGRIRWAVVAEPTQIKSAIGNNGQFDPQNPDIRFNRKDTPADITRRTQNNLIQFFGNRDKSPSLKTFGAYDKTLSTQFNKALKDKHYGKVFGLANAMQNEVSLTSIRPAELAPGVLPRVDDVKSAFKQLVKGKKHDKNLDVAASAIFDGTLDGDSVMTGKIWTKIEFMARPGATETAWALYQQARAAIDASLDEVAAAEAYAMAQGFIPKGMRREIIDAPQQAKNLVTGEITKQINMLNKAIKAAAKMGAAEQEAELVAARAEYDSIQSQVERIFDTAENLKAAGYAPLMRFGKFTVTAQAFDHETGRVMRDENGESITLFHSSYETEGEAKAVRAQLEAKYEGQNVRVAAGAKSQSSHELYAGISPETLALFAEAIGADAAMRKHIELAMSERSALKRRLERKGIEGYSEDMPRVLSNFITSNGRHAAQRYYLRDLNNAIKYIPKEKGDVLDEAIALKKFIVNPNDPAAPVSTVMFAWFLGGSVASAAVNLTQPIMMTAPYLSQFGVSTATKAMAKAMPYAMGKKEINDAEMRSALNRASQEGIVDAQEIFHLYSVGAQGVASGLVNTLAKIPGIGGKIKAGSEDARARANAFLTLWGSMFALAEGFNRKLTFIAAWEVAKENGEKNPYAFAVRAVNETQGIYNKVNRPNWARGAVGRTVLTFKQFSLMYVELLNRMVRHGGPEGKRAALIMLAVLMLAAGEEGIPFAQDLDDLIDTIGQGFGLDTNMKRNKRRVAHEILGKQLGDMFLYGVSSQLPMDFGGRLGLGNMIPGTALLKPSDENTRGRNLAEVMGAAAGLGQQVGDAYDAMVEGNKAKALQNLAPKAVKDVLAGGEMAKKGYSTDAKGRKVVDVGLGDAAFKGIGFNPTKVAQETRKTMPVYQDIALQKATEASIVSKWARGIADNDQEMVKEAQDKWNKWNKDNPDTPISIKPDQIRNQVKSLGNDKDSRILKSAPKEMRRGVGLELAR